MKLSTRLALIAAAFTVGILLLIAFMLQTIYSAMMKDREEQIMATTHLVQQQLRHFVDKEKSGVLSREEAQSRAREAIAGLVAGDNYVFLRDTSGMMLVHPDKRLEGKVSMGAKAQDGRTTMQIYLDALQKGDRVLVEVMTKRQGKDINIPKINGLAKIPEWNWIAGFGMFVDDIDAAFKQQIMSFLAMGVGLVVALCFLITHQIYRTVTREQRTVSQIAGTIASGQLSTSEAPAGQKGVLVDAIHRMQSRLCDVVGNIQKGARVLDGATNDLSGQTGKISEVTRNAAELLAATAAAIEELAVSVDMISQNAMTARENASSAA